MLISNTDARCIAWQGIPVVSNR